ncbi:MAG: MFS transporter [Thermomicrobiales bacterium]
MSATVAGGNRTEPMWAVLQHGPFLRLWLIQALTQTAQNMINFALLLRVRDVVEFHELRQANIAISLVILAFSLPAVLFGPIAGVLADRWNKRTLMASLNMARALSVLLFLVIQPSWHVETILISYYLVTFVFGIAGQFFAPVLGATIPLVTPRSQLIPANALFNLTFTVTQLAGFAALGPVLVKLIGVQDLFILTTVLYVICAGLVYLLPRTPTPERIKPIGQESSASRLWGDMKEGLVFILQDPALMRAIGYLTVASTTFLMLAALGPDFITGVIGLDKEDIGYIVGPAGVGVLLGVLLVPRVIRRVTRGWMIDIALTFAGLILGLMAITRDVEDGMLPGAAPVQAVAIVVGIFAAMLGICNAFILVPAQTMLQERSHEGVRARVYATFFTISNTFSFIPIFFAAAFADLFGTVQVLVIVAVAVGGLGLSGIIHRRATMHAVWTRQRTKHREGPEVLPLWHSDRS